MKNALEIVRREEMNKSLQTLFKEMNDHTINTFEFGKLSLAYLLFFSKKVGSNLTTANGFDGKTIESGKFHFLLEKVTHVVFDTYVKDMEQSQNRLAITNNDGAKYIENQYNSGYLTSDGHDIAEKKNSRSGYDIAVRGFESSITSTLFVVKIQDPKGHQWITKRSWSEFEQLHNILVKESTDLSHDSILVFPEKKMTLNAITNNNEYNESLMIQLDAYCQKLLDIMTDLNNRSQNSLAKFLDTKYIIVTGGDKLHYAESIPNAFIPIKNIFKMQIMGNQAGSTNLLSANIDEGPRKWLEKSPRVAESKSNSANSDEEFVRDILSDKELDEFRRVWGVEYCVKIFDAYALLQRIATVLGWTLEINHFFISMFGNTVTFSRLPLRDIVITLKELLTKFLALSNDLYSFACQLNADSKYKWHKNMQMAENELSRVKFHVDKTLAVISTIESEHLDYEAQMKRLKDVYARFQPFMNRVGPSLANISTELGLPSPQYTLSDYVQNTQSAFGDGRTLLIQDARAGGKDDKISEETPQEISNMNPLRSISSLDVDGSKFTSSPQIEVLEDRGDHKHEEMVIRNEESSSVCTIA